MTTSSPSPITGDPAAPPRKRGRPRSAAHDRAIIDAALALLDRVGYRRMSIEGVAAAAGVTKPTVYLRYSGKQELVAAALERLHVGGAPDLTGEVREDLRRQLEHVRRVLEGVGMPLIGVCIAEQAQLPDLIAALRERALLPGRRRLRAALEGARDRGEIRADADLDLTVEQAVGAYYARYVSGEPFGDDWAAAVADSLIRGLRPD